MVNNIVKIGHWKSTIMARIKGPEGAGVSDDGVVVVVVVDNFVARSFVCSAER